MDRREIEDVEAHVADARQRLRDIVEGAERTREELVPARELGLRPLDLDGDRFAAIGQGAIVGLGDAAAGLGAGQQDDVRDPRHRRHNAATIRSSFSRTRCARRVGDLGRHVDAGAMLDLQRMAKRSRIRRATPRS